MTHALIPATATWVVCLASVVGVLMRPRGTPEWIWAVGGAAALVGFRLLAPDDALAAVARGGDVYLFLAGMMLLAEIARREGVFDWLAEHAVRASGGSRLRLFAIVYAIGIGVTAVLSNDATAVVLTPAVAAAVRRAKAAPLPHVFACAMIANAASFVLPISNPANLVIFAGKLPPLGSWLQAFALPSFAAIVVTFALLTFAMRGELRGAVADDGERTELGPNGKIALGGSLFAAFVLVVASTLGAALGLPALLAALIVVAALVAREGAAALRIYRGVSWSVLLLVAGLFVLVAGLDQTGLAEAARGAALSAAGQSRAVSLLAAALVPGFLVNVVNNLPVALLAAETMSGAHLALRFVDATTIGIDLGPNLSVTGSLATILWLIALRRESIDVNAWRFFRVGSMVMPPALIAATLCLLR